MENQDEKILLVTAVTFTLIFLLQFLEVFDDGDVVHQQGNYSTNYKAWRLLAEKGDVNAQYKIGVMYEYDAGP